MNGEKREISEAQQAQREQAAKKHGAFSYLRRTAAGELIAADLAFVESAVIADVQADGPLARVEKAAVRFGTAAELLWGHMQTSPEAFKSGLSQWGWLQGAEVRAWRDWQALQKAGQGGDEEARRVLEAVKRGDGA